MFRMLGLFILLWGGCLYEYIENILTIVKNFNSNQRLANLSLWMKIGEEHYSEGWNFDLDYSQYVSL